MPAERPAVITGASSGIGLEIARQLAAAGHPVVLCARRVQRCRELAAEIESDGGRAIGLALDVTDAESVAAFAVAAHAAMGDIDIVVSNAGDVRPLDVTGDPVEFVRQVSVNLLGVQLLVHHLVPPMVERGRGDVVVVTSEVALQPRPHMAGYVAAKAGLEAMTQALAMELETTGVRAGIVRPGPTITEQGSTWSGEEVTQALDAWRHWGLVRHAGYLRPEQVAAAVVAMVSAPLGSRLAVIEVQPEAPLRRRDGERS